MGVTLRRGREGGRRGNERKDGHRYLVFLQLLTLTCVHSKLRHLHGGVFQVDNPWEAKDRVEGRIPVWVVMSNEDGGPCLRGEDVSERG